MTSETLSALLGAFGGSATLLVALNFFGRTIVQHLLKKDVEEFKTELKKNADQELKQLEHSLRAANTEHQIRFSKLHQKRAETIADLYGLLSEAIRKSESFVSFIVPWEEEPSKDEKAKLAIKAIDEFVWFFDKHRIYFPEFLELQIDNFIKSIKRPISNTAYYFDYGLSLDLEDSPEQREEQMKAWKSLLDTDFKVARRALESEFRRILGDSIG